MALKSKLLVFLSFGIFAIFFAGVFLSFYHIKASASKKVTQEKAVYCVGNKSCQAPNLSIFSKEKLTENQSHEDSFPKTGFCLQVPVLMYHHVQPEEIAREKGQTSLTVDNNFFDRQMSYLASNGYHTISAEELVNALVSHTQLPPKTVVVTLDDGYLDNYTYAYPIFQKYHLIGNLMVPTGLLGVTAGTNTYFTWDNLKEMVGSGIIFAYNHTWSHFPLGQGSSDKDLYEINTAQNQLKDHLGINSPILVYPYGSGQNMSRVKNLVKDDGYLAAFSTLYGRFQCDSDMMALPRIHIGNAPLTSYGI
ncbi:MAG TPA: polysaccharide deacetylase family protein [Patescibacteria group bacterium]